MQHIDITISGTTPLLCNRFTDAAAAKASSGRSTVAIGDKGSPHEQAAPKLYLGLNGEPMIPVPNMFRCLIDAGKFFKAGKSKITTQKSSILPSCIDFGDQVELKLQHDEPWTVDTRAVRIPSTGGRILCHRPMFHDWTVAFSLRLDEEMLSSKMLRELVDAAGSRIGLGDFRPDCKGMYGKFVVTRWELRAV